MIGIKVPDGCTVQERFKAISNRRRLQYWELLEQWITEEEKKEDVPGQLHLPLAEPAPDVEVILDQKIAELEARILAKFSSPAPDATIPLAAGNSISHDQNSQKIHADTKEQVISEIMRMAADGMSMAQIAKTLEEQGIPTFSGRGHWMSGTISNIIQKAKEKK
jgi:hypothetical protein